MARPYESTYEVIKQIGKGGMSTVYLARHRRLGTQCAIKAAAKSRTFDFLAEANILKRLNHPMLPRIIDIFEDEDYVYLVEDYVEGITLDAYLKEYGPVEEEYAIPWFRDLCGVLDYLHSLEPHPVIYRDLKPSNIMIQLDGSLKLIDFGIAREFKHSADYDTSSIGTRGYAAPEQFGSAQTDARTDIYSLGVCVYHMVTGKSPHEPPYRFVPVRKLNPELSPWLEYVLNKCVQLEPKDRYQNVEELLADFDLLDTASERSRGRRRTRRLQLAAALIMLLVSVPLMRTGYGMVTEDTRGEYEALLSDAGALYGEDLEGARDLLLEAQTLRPRDGDAYAEYAYTLYLEGEYDACIDYADERLETVRDGGLALVMASAHYENGDYRSAAEAYQQCSELEELSAENKRNYAVCLARTGESDRALEVLETVSEDGDGEDMTQYVLGETYLGRGEYRRAEEAFLQALELTDGDSVRQRTYHALAETYRDSAALDEDDEEWIEDAYTKSIDLINEARNRPELSNDAVLCEMLGAAYFNRATLERDDDEEDLEKAAENFLKVIDLGVQKSYLYTNAASAYQAMGDYDEALDILDRMKAAYPDAYSAYSMTAALLIIQENEKDLTDRDYSEAFDEYETALELITAEDDITQLQQLEGLITQLATGGWLLDLE